MMAQAAVKIFENAPDERADNAPIDRSHLSRMTFGDHSLEREVLQLFDRQAELLMERMNASAPAAIATLAHTLKGSAVGIGARMKLVRPSGSRLISRHLGKRTRRCAIQ